MTAVAALAEAPALTSGTIAIAIGDIDLVVPRSGYVPRSPTGPRVLDTGQPSLLSLSRAVRTPVVDAAVQSRIGRVPQR